MIFADSFYSRWVWPAGGSGGIPGDVVATLIWAILAFIVVSLFWPPLRNRVKKVLLHSDQELHRKLDHIIKFHPDIPPLPDAPPTPEH